MKKGIASLAALFFLLYVVLLGVRPLVAPDETRYGEIPREILASGDWVVPHLNGLRYFEKPIMGYWLNAASLRLFGENAFAVRLPSALAVGLSAILLFVCVRKFSEDHVIPLFTTAVFLLCFEIFGVGTFAVLDSMLALFTTSAVVVLFLAYREPEVRKRFVLLVLAGVACGCAFMTKGFIALVIPASVILPFALWEGSLGLCLRTAWVSVISAVLVSLPWGLMVHQRAPDFWHYFFWVEHVNRFISPSGGQHPQPFWYYLPVLLGGAMPWTVLAIPIVQGLRQTGCKDPMIRLAICWLVFPFLFFSGCGGKLATYILPCFPPLAFLIAVGVLSYLRAGKVKGFTVGTGVLVGLAGLLFGALVVGLIVIPQLTVSIKLWPWMIMAASLIAWGVLSRMAITSETVHRRLILFSAGPMLFLFSAQLITPAFVTTPKAPGTFLLSHTSQLPERGILVAGSGMAGSVCWYYRRADVFLFKGKGEYAYGLAYQDSQHRLLDPDALLRLMAHPDGADRLTLIVTTKEFDRNAALLPAPSYKAVSQGLVFAQFNLPTVALNESAAPP